MVESFFQLLPGALLECSGIDYAVVECPVVHLAGVECPAVHLPGVKSPAVDAAPTQCPEADDAFYSADPLQNSAPLLQHPAFQKKNFPKFSYFVESVIPHSPVILHNREIASIVIC